MEKRALAFVACRGTFAKCNLVGNTRQRLSWNSEVSRSRLAATALPVPTINGNICHGCGEGTRKRVGNARGKKVIFQNFWAAVYDQALKIKREFILKMASNYRYTKDSKCLTPQQRIFYENNGYLVFPRLVPQDVLDRCHRRFDDIVSGKAPRDGIIVMYDVKDRKSVNKIQDLTHDEVFDGYFRHKNILDIVEAFTGPNIMAIHSMLIAKPPDVGFESSKHPPHQDLYYFPIRPAHKIVAAWTAMEPCVRENGCLYVAPGTHTHDRLYKHDYAPGSDPGTVNKFYHGILDLPESVDWVHLEMEPGDTVFFHPLLIHGSGVNMSKGTRRAISCHYAAADCNYVDESETGKTRITEELMEYVHKRYPGVQVTYQDIWRTKSTLARGIRSNL
ncbi:putative phytanoyl-CoA dioxygenase isoform X1 [Andrena cerasifolii]